MSYSKLTHVIILTYRLHKYDDVVEFCNRALFLDMTNIKALSRRAAAKNAQGDMSGALEDLDAGFNLIFCVFFECPSLSHCTWTPSLYNV